MSVFFFTITEAYTIQYYYEFLKKYYKYYEYITMTKVEYTDFVQYCHDILKYLTFDTDVFLDNGLCLAEKVMIIFNRNEIVK